MAKVTIFLALGLVAVVCADPLGRTKLVSPITQDQIERFKEELEEDTKDGGLTCENYLQLCAKASGEDPNNVCHIMLHGFLCDKLQDLDGVREIIARIEKQHPEVINLKAGHEFDDKPQKADTELKEDEDGDENSGEYIEKLE